MAKEIRQETPEQLKSRLEKEQYTSGVINTLYEIKSRLDQCSAALVRDALANPPKQVKNNESLWYFYRSAGRIIDSLESLPIELVPINLYNQQKVCRALEETASVLRELRPAIERVMEDPQLPLHVNSNIIQHLPSILQPFAQETIPLLTSCLPISQGLFVTEAWTTRASQHIDQWIAEMDTVHHSHLGEIEERRQRLAKMEGEIIADVATSRREAATLLATAHVEKHQDQFARSARNHVIKGIAWGIALLCFGYYLIDFGVCLFATKQVITHLPYSIARRLFPVDPGTKETSEAARIAEYAIAAALEKVREDSKGKSRTAFDEPAFIEEISRNLDSKLLHYIELREIVGRLVIISVFLLLIRIALRNLYTHLHLAKLDAHRSNALQTFRDFRNAAHDPHVKDEVLLEATRTIFAPPNTGLLGGKGTELSNDQIFQLFKGTSN